MVRWQRARLDDLTPRALHAVLMLRADVFVVEQDCAYLDPDTRDLDALHVLGWDGDVLAATARVLWPGVAYPECAIGRVVVARSHRRTGLGQALMRESMAAVQELWGPVPIRLSAQAYLRQFYEGLGYRVIGEGYLEDGIPHLPMRHDP